MKGVCKILFFVIGIIFINACDKQADNFELEKEFDYYPLEIGKYKIYEVDSTIYDPNGIPPVQQFISQIREEIVDTLSDNNGNTVYKIEQFTRADSSEDWTIKNVYTQQLIENRALRTEENLKFIKLVFPAERNTSWDGNIFFEELTTVNIAGELIEMFKGWDYRIESVGEPETLGDLSFDEVLLVQQADNENLIELRRSNEKYAKGIGLIYREMWILNTQCISSNPGCESDPWEEKAEEGFILKQKILEYN